MFSKYLSNKRTRTILLVVVLFLFMVFTLVLANYISNRTQQEDVSAGVPGAKDCTNGICGKMNNTLSSNQLSGLSYDLKLSEVSITNGSIQKITFQTCLSPRSNNTHKGLYQQLGDAPWQDGKNAAGLPSWACYRIGDAFIQPSPTPTNTPTPVPSNTPSPVPTSGGGGGNPPATEIPAPPNNTATPVPTSGGGNPPATSTPVPPSNKPCGQMNESECNANGSRCNWIPGHGGGGGSCEDRTQGTPIPTSVFSTPVVTQPDLECGKPGQPVCPNNEGITRIGTDSFETLAIPSFPYTLVFGGSNYQNSRIGGSNRTMTLQEIAKFINDSGLNHETKFSMKVVIEGKNNQGTVVVNDQIVGESIVFATAPTATPQNTNVPTPSPTPVFSLSTEFVNGSNVMLTWNAIHNSGQPPIDRPGGGAELLRNNIVGYQVQSCNGEDCSSFSAINTTTSRTYTDTRSWGTTTYRRYKIAAVDSADRVIEETNVVKVKSPTHTPPPTDSSGFSNLSAELKEDKATFNFTYANNPTHLYQIQVSKLEQGTFTLFGQGTASPIVITDVNKSFYTCGNTLYWRVKNTTANKTSEIVTSVIDCEITSTSTPTPTNTPSPTPTGIGTVVPEALTCTMTHTLANQGRVDTNVTYTVKLNKQAPSPNGTVIIRNDYPDSFTIVSKPSDCHEKTQAVQSSVLGISDYYEEKGSVLISVLLFSALTGGVVYLVVLKNKDSIGSQLLKEKPYLAGLLAAGVVMAIGAVYFLATQDDVSPTDTPALTGKYLECNVQAGTDTITYTLNIQGTVGSKAKNIAEVQTGTNPAIKTCSTEFTIIGTSDTITPSDTAVPGATNTPVPAATDTPVPGTTDTPVPGETDTPEDTQEPTAIVTDPPLGFICGAADINGNGTFDIDDFGRYQEGFASHYQKECDDTEEMRETYMPCGGKDVVPGTDGNFGKIDILDFQSFASRYNNEVCDLPLPTEAPAE